MLVATNRAIEMLAFEQDESAYRVRYSSYLLPLLFLGLPPALIYEHYAGIVDGSISSGELLGLGIGILLPILGITFLVEFGSFTFSGAEGVFRWRWRNLFRKQNGEVPLSRIARIRRDARDTSEHAGLQYTYRLVVILDDGSLIPLSRGYSSLHAKTLDKIAAEIRDYLGHDGCYD